MEHEMIYTVHIERAEEGGFWAYVPALPGCFTQGKTLEEVIRMAKEAITGFVEVLVEKGQPLPIEAAVFKTLARSGTPGSSHLHTQQKSSHCS